MTDENDQGLIPVQLSEFVTNDTVDAAKLWPVLDKVEAAWSKRLANERESEEAGAWRSVLGRRISWPMAEIGENLSSLTTECSIKTERDRLREENHILKGKINWIAGMILKVTLNPKTIIDQVKALKDSVCG